MTITPELLFDSDPNSVAHNTSAMNNAVALAIETGRVIYLEGSTGYACVNELKPIPNDHSQTINIIGAGKRNTVLHVIGTGALIQLGDSERSSRNAHQNWGGFQISDVGFKTKTASHAIAFEWRYSDTRFQRCHFEGFKKAAVGDLNPEPKSWDRVFDGCSFAHNNRGIQTSDHGTVIKGMCRFYWNTVGVEINSSAYHNIQGDFGPASEAQILLTGKSITAVTINAYLENGYDTTTSSNTRPVSIDGYETQVKPKGAIRIKDANVWGLTIDTSHAQMQHSDWFVEIDNNNNEAVRMIYKGGVIDKKPTKTGDIISIIGSSKNVDMLVYEHVYCSNGDWEKMTNKPEAFCKLPSGFGTNVC